MGDALHPAERHIRETRPAAIHHRHSASFLGAVCKGEHMGITPGHDRVPSKPDESDGH